MNWFQGAIADAVSESKIRNAVFVVFVEGKDENTRKLSNFINEEKIRCKLESEHFVAIKIESDSESYIQFAKIYQVVPVPSIFFIGRHGTPLEIGTGVMQNVDELERKIDNVLSLSERNTPSELSTISTLVSEQSVVSTLTPASEEKPQVAAATATATATATVAATATEVATSSSSLLMDELYCDGDVCYKKPKETQENVSVTQDVKPVENPTVSKPNVVEQVEIAKKETELPSSSNNTAAEATSALKLEETRKLLEQKRLERVEEQRKLDKERELKRRQEGKDMQNAKLWQKEQELKDLKESIRREKQIEKETRDRIRAQIAADRAERAQKFELSSSSNHPNTAPTTAAEGSSTASNADSARIQFRLPNGVTKSNTFKCDDTVLTLRNYVKAELLTGTGIKDFTLATTYPKREFTTENDEQTLMELGLLPSAVILVIGKESGATAIIQRSGGLLNIVSKVFWVMLTPIMAIINYIQSYRRSIGDSNDRNNVGAQKRAADDLNADAAKRRNLDRYLTNIPTTSHFSQTNSAASDGGIAPTTNTTDNDNSKAYRRYAGSNIHRLSDNRKDSDDENATWNGNSTQQQ